MKFISFKYKGKIKTIFTYTKADSPHHQQTDALQEVLKEVLQAKRKLYQMEIWSYTKETKSIRNGKDKSLIFKISSEDNC